MINNLLFDTLHSWSSHTFTS